MFPPGRIFFMRPLKSRAARRAARDAFIVKSWDGVYATAQELVAEGILVGKAMLEVRRKGGRRGGGGGGRRSPQTETNK